MTIAPFETVATTAIADTLSIEEALAQTNLTSIREWVAVCEFERLEREFGVAALLAGEHVALFRTFDDRLFATSNIDPETGVSAMSRGIMGDKNGVATIASPVLKAVFSLETGECLNKADMSLKTYPVRIINGVVEVGMGVA